MFNYYLFLAIRSFKRNVALTLLMIVAIGVGIGASMSVVTIYRAVSGDPIPNKSSQLFVPQIDNWGPVRKESAGTPDNLPDQLSYADAIALINARVARKQTAMYETGLALVPPSAQLLPFRVRARATYADFFSMFEVPFLFGRPWNAEDDAAHASVVVLTQELNDKLFGGANSVGKSVHLGSEDYRVVGVLNAWKPTPRFYDVIDNRYGKLEDVLLPFTHAIDRQLAVWGNVDCNGDSGGDWEGRRQSNCVWIQFWAELAGKPDVEKYQRFLDNYAAEQSRTGRFSWSARTALRNERQWLAYERVVPTPVKVMAIVSTSFLIVCLVNAMGMMLAKIIGRSREIGLRRALGASRYAIFYQFMVEASIVGFVGGLLGLLLTELGLLAMRSMFSQDVLELTHLNFVDIGIAIVLAITSTIIAGVYPTWRAAGIRPAWQLKTR